MKDSRLNKIVQLVEESEKMYVNDLSELLNVTKETIRRDLSELENEKRISRIHGAAIPFQSNSNELFYNRKYALNEDVKRNIAKEAASLIESNDMIAVDGGTTTVHIPDYLNDIKGLKVVTNSLTFALKFNEALEHKRVEGELIIIPGISYSQQNSVKGAMSVQFLSQCYFDKAFISCGGYTDNIVTEFDLEETEISRVMMQQSKNSFLLSDSSKKGKVRAFKIANLNEFKQLIIK
nr:DeoR/GlpR family DNA-binding transcription regulator [Mammaliicoccus sp. Marseille-Q6498]